MPEHDLSRLPKWAQMRIQKLESDVAHYKGEAQEMAGEEGDPKRGPRILLHPFQENPVRLPRGANVGFGLGEDEGRLPSVICRAEWWPSKDLWALRVYASRDWLIVWPGASNTIHVHAEGS